MIARDIWRKPINYPLSLTLAVIAGFFWIIFSEREEQPERRIEAGERRVPDPFIAGTAALVAAILTARLGYIALHIDYFRANPLEILYLWEGGLSGVAAGVGMLIGLGAYTLYTEGSFWELGDALAIPLQFVMLGSWAGCWFEGCAYGSPTEIDLYITGTDPYGSTIRRWPTQGMGVLLSVFSFGMLTWLGERETPPGLRFALSFTAGALSSAVIGLYRSDPVMLVGPARLDTVGYALLGILGMFWMSSRLYGKEKVREQP